MRVYQTFKILKLCVKTHVLAIEAPTSCTYVLKAYKKVNTATNSVIPTHIPHHHRYVIRCQLSIYVIYHARSHQNQSPYSTCVVREFLHHNVQNCQLIYFLTPGKQANANKSQSIKLSALRKS